MSVTASSTVPQPAAPGRAGGGKVTLRDLIIVVFYYRTMLMGIMAGALLCAIAAWTFSPARYTAQLQLLLLPGTDTANPLNAGASALFGGNAARDVDSEIEFIRNRSLLAKVAEDVGPGRIVPGLGERRLLGLLPPVEEKEQINSAVDALERQLKVTNPANTDLLVVLFQHRDRDTAIAVVDKLTDTYLQRRSELLVSLKSPFLKEKAQSFAKQLDKVEESIREEKSKNNILDFNQEILLALNRVDSGVQRRQSESERRAGLLGEIEETKRRIAETPATVFDFLEKTDRVDNDDTDNMLVKLYLERDRLSDLYQPDDERRVEIDRQIDTLEKVKRQPRREFSVRREVRNPTLDFLTNHLMQVQVEADSVNKSIDELTDQIQKSQQRVDDLRNAENRLHSLERSRGVIEQLYRDYTTRAEAAQVEEAAAALKTANIRIVAPADATLKSESGGINLALALLVAGLVVAAAAALIADWNRQVFLLPDEMETALGLPVLGTFNEGQDFAGGASIGQIIFLAGQLGFHSGEAGGMRRLQVVSQGVNEYRREFALALARELAEGQNMRTLLLDLVEDGTAQWRALGSAKPTHETAGFRLAPTAHDKLHVSIGASHSAIQWQRANKEMLDQLFEELGKRYDMVVLDVPPYRAGTEAVRLAPLVTGTILVARAEHTKRSVLDNLLAQLLGAGGDLYGAVLTGRKFYVPRAIYRWL